MAGRSMMRCASVQCVFAQQREARTMIGRSSFVNNSVCGLSKRRTVSYLLIDICAVMERDEGVWWCRLRDAGESKRA